MDIPVNDFNISKFLSLDEDVIRKFITKSLMDTKPNPLKDVTAQYAANFIKNTCTNTSTQKLKITIHESLTFEESKALTDAFPEFDIKFISDVVNNHGYAAASRKCENYLLLIYCGYDFDKFYSQVCILDFGGNWAVNVIRDFSGIHSCSPLLNDYDNLRFSSRINQLSRFATNGIRKSEFQQSVLTNFDKFILEDDFNLPLFCTNKAQECTVKSDYAISLHACYDMTLVDIADAMASRDVRELYGTFIWHPSILLKPEGVIPILNAHYRLVYSSVVDENSLTLKKNKIPVSIIFSFKNDSSLNYEHNFINYISFLTVSTFYSSDRSCKFVLELRENRNGIQFYKITRLIVPSPYNSFNLSLRHKIWFPDSENFCAVTYYELDDDKISSFKSGLIKYDRNCYGLLRKCVMLVDKKLITETLSYAYRVSEDKFKPIELVSYLQTHDRRIFFSSKDILSRTCVHDADQLFTLANIIYIYAYIRKYDQGKVNQCLLNDIRFDRKLLSAGLFEKFFLSNDHSKVFDIPSSPFFSWLHSLLFVSTRTGLNASDLIQDQIKFLEFDSLVSIADPIRDKFVQGLDKVFQSIENYYSYSSKLDDFILSFKDSKTASLSLPSFSTTKSEVFTFDLDRLVFESLLNLTPGMDNSDKEKIRKLVERMDDASEAIAYGCKTYEEWLAEGESVVDLDVCFCNKCQDFSDNDCSCSVACLSDEECCVEIDEFTCVSASVMFAKFKVEAFLKNSERFSQTKKLYDDYEDFEITRTSCCTRFNVVEVTDINKPNLKCPRCVTNLSLCKYHSVNCWLAVYPYRIIKEYEKHFLNLLESFEYSKFKRLADSYFDILQTSFIDLSDFNLEFLITANRGAPVLENKFMLSCSFERFVSDVFNISYKQLLKFYYVSTDKVVDSGQFAGVKLVDLPKFLKNNINDFNEWVVVLIALVRNLNIRFISDRYDFTVLVDFYGECFDVVYEEGIIRVCENLIKQKFFEIEYKYKFLEQNIYDKFEKENIGDCVDAGNSCESNVVVGDLIDLNSNDSSSRIATPENYYKTLPIIMLSDACCEDVNMSLVKVPGDGMCLLRSLARDRDMQEVVEDLKGFLIEITRYRDLRIAPSFTEQELAERMTDRICVNLSRLDEVFAGTLWGGDDLIWLFSACYQVNICVHTPECHVYFTNSMYTSTIHLCYDGFHYDYFLVDRESVPLNAIINADENSNTDVSEFLVSDRVITNNTQSLCDNSNVLNFVNQQLTNNSKHQDDCFVDSALLTETQPNENFEQSIVVESQVVEDSSVSQECSTTISSVEQVENILEKFFLSLPEEQYIDEDNNNDDNSISVFRSVNNDDDTLSPSLSEISIHLPSESLCSYYSCDNGPNCTVCANKNLLNNAIVSIISSDDECQFVDPKNFDKKFAVTKITSPLQSFSAINVTVQNSFENIRVPNCDVKLSELKNLFEEKKRLEKRYQELCDENKVLDCNDSKNVNKRNQSNLDKRNQTKIYEENIDENKDKNIDKNDNISNENLLDKTNLHTMFNIAYSNRNIEGFKYEYYIGDLFKQKCSLAHCVSADLYMGKGIALTFRKIFGKVQVLKNQNPKVVSVLNLSVENRYIYYIVTKQYYNDKPTLKNFFLALVELRKCLLKDKVYEIAIPLIGCGLDELRWFDVFGMLAYVFKNDPIKFKICVPDKKEFEKCMQIESGLGEGGINSHLRNSYPQLYGRYAEALSKFKVMRSRGFGVKNFKNFFDLDISFNVVGDMCVLTGVNNCKIDYVDIVSSVEWLKQLYIENIDNFGGLVFGVDLKDIDIVLFIEFLQAFNEIKIYIPDAALNSAFMYIYINVDSAKLDVSTYMNKSLHKIVAALEHKLTCTACIKTVTSKVKVSREIYENVWSNCGEFMDDLNVLFVAGASVLKTEKIFTVKIKNDNSFSTVIENDICTLTVDNTTGTLDDDYFPRVWCLLENVEIPFGYAVLFDCTEVLYDRKYLKGFLGKCKTLYVVTDSIRRSKPENERNDDAKAIVSKYISCTDLKAPDYLPVNNEFEYRINAFREIKYMINSQVKILRRDIEDLHKQSLTIVAGIYGASKMMVPDFGLYDITKNKWVIKPLLDDINEYAWAFDGENLVSIQDDENDKFVNMRRRGIRYISVNKRTKTFTSPQLVNALNMMAESQLDDIGKFMLVEGAPGCGKSTYILRNHKFINGSDIGDIVLTTTREAANDLRKRAMQMYVCDNERMLKRKYRTGDSYLINSVDRCETLWVDEGLMKHAGEILAYAIKSEASKIIILGDAAQIPFINRFREIKVKYSNIKSMGIKTTYLNVTRRCPLDVAVCLNRMGMYAFTIKSSNSVKRSMNVKYTFDLKPSMISEDTVVLTFTQAEKEELYKNGFKKIHTVHEFQGNQAANVILIRTNHKKNEIYESPNHNVVAISRHTKTFTYYTSVINDYTSRLVSKVYDDTELINVYEKESMRGGFRMCPDFEVDIKPAKTFVMYKQHKLSRDIVEKNFFTGYRAFMPILREVPTLKFNDVQLTAEERDIGDYTVLQEFYDKVFPGNSIYDRTYDQEIIEMSDFVVNCDAFCIDLNGFVLPSRKPTLIPNLRTSIQPPIINSLRMVMYAFAERNGGVPDLVTETSRDNLVFSLLESFITTYVDDFNLFNSYSLDPLSVNTEDILEWFYTQPPKVQNEVEAQMEEIIYNRDLSRFYYILKKNAKPVLDSSGINKFQAPQTIAFHDKLVNSVFCPLVRAMKLRLYAVLKKNFIIMSDMSIEDFEELMNYRFPPKLAKGFGYSLELDISKYDKSQQEMLFRTEETLMLMLGFPSELIPYWRYAHAFSTLHNLATKFTGKTVYQRKSGDAMTFFGNTILLMSVMSYVYDLKNTFAMFSGDDSYVFSKIPMGSIEDSYDFAFMFNLETKLLHYKYPYFCSKFLIPINENEWKVVPDPIKIITKFGRSDLVDWTHVEEYRISTCDLVKCYADYNVRSVLNHALCDRYDLNFDTEFFVLVLYSISNNKIKFKQMFMEPIEGLSTYTVRPSLDI